MRRTARRYYWVWAVGHDGQTLLERFTSAEEAETAYRVGWVPGLRNLLDGRVAWSEKPMTKARAIAFAKRCGWVILDVITD